MGLTSVSLPYVEFRLKQKQNDKDYYSYKAALSI